MLVLTAAGRDTLETSSVLATRPRRILTASQAFREYLGDLSLCCMLFIPNSALNCCLTFLIPLISGNGGMYALMEESLREGHAKRKTVNLFDSSSRAFLNQTLPILTAGNSGIFTIWYSNIACWRIPHLVRWFSHWNLNLVRGFPHVPPPQFRCRCSHILWTKGFPQDDAGAIWSFQVHEWRLDWFWRLIDQNSHARVLIFCISFYTLKKHSSSDTLQRHPAADDSSTLKQYPAAAPCTGAPKHTHHSNSSTLSNTLQRHPAAAAAPTCPLQNTHNHIISNSSYTWSKNPNIWGKRWSNRTIDVAIDVADWCRFFQSERLLTLKPFLSCGCLV